MLQNTAKLSDGKIAKKAGVSQPTVTRQRQMFERKGHIKSYQIIPDFDKIGYPIFAVLQIAPHSYDPGEQELKEELKEKPEIIFQASTPLFIIALSVHKTFHDYMDFCTELYQTSEVKTVVLGLTRDITKPFEIRNLDIHLGKP